MANSVRLRSDVALIGRNHLQAYASQPVVQDGEVVGFQPREFTGPRSGTMTVRLGRNLRMIEDALKEFIELVSEFQKAEGEEREALVEGVNDAGREVIDVPFVFIGEDVLDGAESAAAPPFQFCPWVFDPDFKGHDDADEAAD